MVPSAKTTANLGQAARGQLLGQKHRDLTRAGDVAQTLWADHVRQAYVVIVGHPALDFLDRQLAIRGAQDVGKAVLRQVQRDFPTNKTGEGEKPGQRAF